MIAKVMDTPKLEDLKVQEVPVICKQFVAILRRITKAAEQQTLEEGMAEFHHNTSFWNESHHFHWEISNERMWVKQRGNDDMLIYVLLPKSSG